MFSSTASSSTEALRSCPHQVGLLGDGLEDGLANPPHRIGDELEASCLVKLLGSLDKAQVPLVNQVRQRQALVLVLLGYRYDKTQVGADEFVQCGLLSLVDALGEFHLLVDRNEFFTADFLKILLERRALAVGD